MTDTAKPKPTSLRDIAERTGVSAMTVQRAVGAPHLVAEKTRRRILRVMQEVGYVPDRNAASLVSRSSGRGGRGRLGAHWPGAVKPLRNDDGDMLKQRLKACDKAASLA